MTRSPRTVAAHAPFLGLLAAGVALRFVGLGRWPAPAGDEGNWTSWALALHRGEPVDMPAEASYVSLAFPRAMAQAFDLVGPSFASARSVNALCGLLAAVAAYAAYAATGARRAGLAAAAVLLLHPWSVMWSRCAAVPYAVALATMTVGALAYVHGLQTRRGPWLAFGVVVVSLGAHVSPLTAVAALACGIATLRPDGRHALRSPWLYGALAVALALTAARFRDSVAVASLVQPSTRGLTAVGKVARLVHMGATGLVGEATLRHVGFAALSPAGAVLPALALVPFFGALVRGRAALPPLARFGALCLVLGAVCVPALLAPARLWYVPDIDRERYLFALLPGFALLVGAGLREGAPRAERRSAGLVLALLVLATVRMGVDARFGAGVDAGAGVFEGGRGYRGFRMDARGQAPVVALADRILEVLPRHSGVVLAESSLRPLAFELARRVGRSPEGHPGYYVVESEYFRAPYSYTGRYAFVVWSDDVFAGEPHNEPARAASAALRTRMHAAYRGARRVETWHQADGRGLVELWLAEARPAAPPLPGRVE